VVARAPLNPRGHCNLGVALVDEQRFDEARVALERALALRADFPLAWVALGNAHLGRRALEPAECARAAECYRRALALEPSAHAHHGLANALLYAGDAAAAEGEYRAALALEPESAAYRFDLANALHTEGRANEALPLYEEALRLAPDFQAAHVNLAALLEHLGRLDEALAHDRAALALAPNSAAESFNLGRHLLALGREDEALAAFREACRVDGDMAAALQITARMLALRPQSSAEERQEAVTLAERAVRLTDSKELVELETLGLCHAALGEHEDALQAFQSALALGGADAQAVARLRAESAQSRAHLRR
jgi:tetratricopeptide (TPR) repeat protein